MEQYDGSGRRPLILASGSPRRRALLETLKLPFRIVPSGVREEVEGWMKPDEAALELARQKADRVASRVDRGLVLGADTLIDLDGRILGKPADARDACRMLSCLAGRRHYVVSALVLIQMPEEILRTGLVRTLVQMQSYGLEVIEEYVASGEPLDKAGSYAIQEGGGRLVERMEGCYTNVVGLPLCELVSLLDSFEVQVGKEDAIPCRLADGTPCPRWHRLEGGRPEREDPPSLP